MSYHFSTPLFASITNLVLGVLVLRSNSRARMNQVFAFLALTLALWNLNFAVLYSVSDHDFAFRLSRVLRTGTLFMPPAVFHLVIVLKARRSRLFRSLLVIDYAFACLLALANRADLLVSDLQAFAWGYYSVGGPLYSIFTVFLILNFGATLSVLIYDYRHSTDPHMRLQLQFWLLGAIVAFPLGCTNLLPAYGVPFYPLGSLGNAVWAGIVAYAIVRHRLMDIDLVVTKGMSYSAVAFVLIAPTFLIILWLQRRSFGQIHPDFSVAMLILLVAVGVLFPTLRFRAESRIERSLFREKHEYRAALIAFTRSIVRILDRQRLVRELATALSETWRLDRIAVALYEEPHRVFVVQHTVGARPTKNEFSDGDAFILALSRSPEPVLREELEESARPAEREVVTATCQQNGWQVCIPLTAGGRLIGFISLGRKYNMDAFFVEDLSLLGTLAAEASVALENARLYEELKRSQDLIRRADRLSALGTLAAGIAHEVRNPLVSIQTFFQLAPSRLHDEEFLTTFLSMTAAEVKRISSLIAELLSFASSPTRTLGPVSLNDAVVGAVTLLDPEARKHQLTLTSELCEDAPVVLGDSDQTRQILINLVLNAIQATQPGGTVTISTYFVRQGGLSAGQFVVADNGPGIPQEQIDHIFDPFFTTKESGTGLGLAIVHQIVMEHGGSISVDSKPGVGTRFLVNLPVADQNAAQGGPRVSTPATVDFE